MYNNVIWLLAWIFSMGIAQSDEQTFPRTSLAPSSFEAIPLGNVAPSGWLLEQLLLQANSLSGYMSKSTFPGAVDVNTSLWIGGDGKKGGGTTQWLPYWTNGNVPLVELVRAAGAEDRLHSDLKLADTVDQWMEYILKHTNRSNGWIGPYMNEPGDSNGHGLWDPLNMLRSLFNYAQAHKDKEKEIATAGIAHLTQESKLLKTDPVYKWAGTRWPTFVEICQYAIDKFVPIYGSDPEVMPLGGEVTTSMLLNASVLFQAKGMDWHSYYHQTGNIKFPNGSVNGWNTNDHGVNNAEGALRWPAVAYRMSGSDSYQEEMKFVLHMLDKYQGQVQSLFCADEVFCGRAPHRGTETCAVVEAMASLEFAFVTLGQLSLMDRVERLAFNALPASLTADMWTHVYVQQANSVFAGRTRPKKPIEVESDKCTTCNRGNHTLSNLHDEPSGEDLNSNFFGVSHFPCCITNFPQGWPKFAMHAFVIKPKDNAFVVASLVPSKAVLPNTIGQGTIVVTESMYPFGDSANITVTANSSTTALVRIPGWAHGSTVDGKVVANGTLISVQCPKGKTVIRVVLHAEPVFEWGLGSFGVKAASSVNYTTNPAGANVPTTKLDSEAEFQNGASIVGSRTGGLKDIRSGTPGQNTSVVILHLLQGLGHYIKTVDMTYRYAAGYSPPKNQTKLGSIFSLALVDASTQNILQTIYTSPVLDKYSFDDFHGYSPPINVSISNLKVPNSKPVLLVLKFQNNQRNLQIQLDKFVGLGLIVHWTSSVGPDPPSPPSNYIKNPTNAVAVIRGPLVFTLHPKELFKVTARYDQFLPDRPKAVDYEISTNQTWNYGLLIGSKKPVFDNTPSSGWSTSLPFSTEEYPFSIEVEARKISEWGYWRGSKVTDQSPPSPYNCTSNKCGPPTKLTLVPFGGTNIRISVFPWIYGSDRMV